VPPCCGSLALSLACGLVTTGGTLRHTSQHASERGCLLAWQRRRAGEPLLCETAERPHVPRAVCCDAACHDEHRGTAPAGADAPRGSDTRTARRKHTHLQPGRTAGREARAGLCSSTGRCCCCPNSATDDLMASMAWLAECLLGVCSRPRMRHARALATRWWRQRHRGGWESGGKFRRDEVRVCDVFNAQLLSGFVAAVCMCLRHNTRQLRLRRFELSVAVMSVEGRACCLASHSRSLG
jgi:hypothetical protein